MAFSEWKKKEIGHVKNEKDIVCNRFHRSVARQVDFSLRHAYIMQTYISLQLTSTDARALRRYNRLISC